MAEFKEVMKKCAEICNRGKCGNCPIKELKNRKNVAGCFNAFIKCYEEAEELIMTWEPPVDWSKVAVDTKILVKDHKDSNWIKRYFAKYEDGAVYAWNCGIASWTAEIDEVERYEYAKLAEEGE